MWATLELANSSYCIHLMGKKLARGDVMAQLGKTFPTSDGAR